MGTDYCSRAFRNGLDSDRQIRIEIATVRYRSDPTKAINHFLRYVAVVTISHSLFLSGARLR
jgi:hypothetical protein